MVSTWRWRRRQPTNLWLYGGLSLVLHGAALLALQWAHPPLDIPEPEKPPPIEIVEAPPVVMDDTPPPDTPNRAARNTVEQGTVRPDAPRNWETTQRVTPSSATPALPQPQPATAPTPMAQAEPQPQPESAPNPIAQPEPLPSPVAQPEPKPEPVAQPEPKPEPVARPLFPLPPQPEPVPLPPAASSPSPALPATQPAPAVTRPQVQPAAPPAPAPPKVAAAPPKGNASLLGGTLSKDARHANLDQEANPTRNAPGPTQLAARQDVDLGPYLANLRRRVQQNWNPNTPDQRRQAVIGFTISRSGQISNMRILQTSGSPQTDAETILAIQRAAPFGALPEQFPYNQLEIEFTFNIYVNNAVIQTPRSWYGF